MQYAGELKWYSEEKLGSVCMWDKIQVLYTMGIEAWRVINTALGVNENM